MKSIPLGVTRLRQTLGGIAAPFRFEHSSTSPTWDPAREVDGWGVVFHAELADYPNAEQAFGYGRPPMCLDLWLNVEMASAKTGALRRVEVVLEGNEFSKWLIDCGKQTVASVLVRAPIDVTEAEGILMGAGADFIREVMEPAR